MIFFFNDTATTEIYTLSLHDALPIFADQFLDFPYELVEGQGGGRRRVDLDDGLLAGGGLADGDEARDGRVEDELLRELGDDLRANLFVEVLPRGVDGRERHHELVGGVRGAHLCDDAQELIQAEEGEKARLDGDDDEVGDDQAVERGDFQRGRRVNHAVV